MNDYDNVKQKKPKFCIELDQKKTKMEKEL